MNNTWSLIFFGGITAYFGLKALQLAPTVFKLLAALRTGEVQWPGPRIHDPDHRASVVRERLGVGYQNLFSAFIANTLGVVAAFLFSMLTFLGHTSFMRGYVRLEWSWVVVILTLLAFLGGAISFEKARQNMAQVRAILSDLANTAEPRAVDAQSAEAEYAIEHPLIGHRSLQSDSKRALDMFYESACYRQAGHERRALMLYQNAMRIDPALHNHAGRALSHLSQDCSPAEAGPIYYWLGIHAEYLGDSQQAATWYRKAAAAFEQLGYKKRQGRAHCNLGALHLKLGNYRPGMEALKKAIALNPGDGIAHFNIGMIYYRSSDPGEETYERALDSFAEAIGADPEAYGPMIAARMRSHAYTWQEDLAEVLRRVANK